MVETCKQRLRKTAGSDCANCSLNASQEEAAMTMRMHNYFTSTHAPGFMPRACERRLCQLNSVMRIRISSQWLNAWKTGKRRSCHGIESTECTCETELD
eukprot:CAMPEP_0177478184 /NCGR_PEP_ID=MMETSP0369-20130122/24544_1 /TAXON_ID=447022 ORGANISM="Scrippsiella hangoei-like, Strain SHHI-4" /NCGR_SAMPLE_ID=MMETSP0369 /ASSEMBLY_ACC=CAM_ASM_000364 /LENGTH=98 /DNA_ID=CAMNT_0018953583 /DNA_START=289 /DNA_END=582 /DNA_ORIENTATION=+